MYPVLNTTLRAPPSRFLTSRPKYIDPYPKTHAVVPSNTIYHIIEILNTILYTFFVLLYDVDFSHARIRHTRFRHPVLGHPDYFKKL